MTVLLPEGWERDELWFGVVLSAPDIGFVTINEKKRGFAMGHGSPVKPMTGYAGRGWKERLYADAIKALQQVLEAQC